MHLETKPPQIADLPKPLGKVVAEYHLAPQSAIAYSVKTGQYIQIIDVEGTQCSDFLAFAGDNYSQEIDGTVTRTFNGLSMPQVGLLGKYFSQTMQPLFEVVQDTCGRHDSFLLACAPRYYEDAGYPGHPSCSENFNQVLSFYGIAARRGWAAVNFFFNTEVDHNGAITSGESWSRPGDYVLLQAKQDLLCASSACPDDIDPANGWQPTSIHVRIYDASEQFPQAIGRRTSANAPLRLTKESAFTPNIRKLTDNLTEYNGFWVPNSFTSSGLQQDYWALRSKAVVIDLSALRKFEITGIDAFNLLQMAFSRDISKLVVGQSVYGCLLNPHGGIIDDGIVFRLTADTYRYIGNCDRNAAWLEKVAQQFKFEAMAIPASDNLHNIAIQGPRLWDIAGVDGLQVVKDLTKCDRITTIAPFQSLETTINGDHCAILRLCEGNFRIGWQGDHAILESALEPLIKSQRVWVQRFNWLGAITITESVGIDYLPQIAVAKPPHRLALLKCDRAVPARIDDISVLIWRHLVLNQPAFELHTALTNLELIKAKLNLASTSVN